MLLTVIIGGCAGTRPTYRVMRDLPYGADRGESLFLDMFLPLKPGVQPAVLLIHGGAWMHGDKDDMAGMAAILAAKGFVAVAINYRLASAGTVGYPFQVDDVREATGWVRAHAPQYHVDASRIGVFGVSAGAHLAAMAAAEEPTIHAAVLWSTPTDLPQLAGNRAIKDLVATFVGCAYPSCPRIWRDASPVSHVSARMAPTLFFTSADELVPVNQAYTLQRRLNAAHVPHRLVLYPGTGHGFAYAQSALPLTLAFFHSRLSR